MNHQLITSANATALAVEIANRLQAKLASLLETSTGPVHLALTGGTIGIACLAELAKLARLDGSQWSRIHIWWGDERFVAADSPDRNALQAKKVLLDFVPIPASNLHEFPSADQDLTLNQAADRFELVASRWFGELASEPTEGQGFDLLLLGVGPDGHIASLFPGRGHETGRWIIAEPDSPKPPRERLSFSLQALLHSKEVWLLVSGSEKAPVLARALSADRAAMGFALGSALGTATGTASQSEPVTAQSKLPVELMLLAEKLLWLVDEAANPGR